MRSVTIPVFAIAFALTLPAQPFPPGTQVSVRLGQTISSELEKPGDSWSGTLLKDVIAGENVLAHRGDPVVGRVVEAKGSGELALQVTAINGEPMQTDTVNNIDGSNVQHKRIVAGAIVATGSVVSAATAGSRGAMLGARSEHPRGKYPVDSIMTFTVR